VQPTPSRNQIGRGAGTTRFQRAMPIARLFGCPTLMTLLPRR
jgi:hypothetical protein